MTVNETFLIYFSPTSTSKHVGESIVQGIGQKNVNLLDITLNSTDDITLPASALAVIVVPVYGGRVAPLAMDRLQKIHGTDTPTVLVVVYGNRDYESSLSELNSYAVIHGLKSIAGATFIGEHSYSTEKYPIAKGRPDKTDLNIAEMFGKRVRSKIEEAIRNDALSPVNVEDIRRPHQSFLSTFRFVKRVLKFRKSGVPLPQTPVLMDESLCNHCGVCSCRCPIGAITKGNEGHADADKCIKCNACVKLCPKQIRVYDTPFSAILSSCFKKQKLPQTIL